MAGEGRPENLTPLERFGVEVREVRRGRKITQKRLATIAGYSEGYVSKVESGAIMPSQKFADACDLAFGTNGLFRRLRNHIQEGDSPTWFVSYLELERKALRVLDFSATQIMGMLQTEDYARAIYRAGRARESEERIRGLARARVRRREVLKQDRPPMLWVVLHEACLRTPVGGRRIMADQLEHLVTWASGPGVDIQIIPHSTGAAAAHSLPFTVLTFAGEPAILYAEDVQGGRLYRSLEAVDRAMENYDRLRANAMSPDDSIHFVQSLLKEYTS
jgi:transcriptional regulator with XRE-family HTH domain